MWYIFFWFFFSSFLWDIVAFTKLFKSLTVGMDMNVCEERKGDKCPRLDSELDIIQCAAETLESRILCKYEDGPICFSYFFDYVWGMTQGVDKSNPLKQLWRVWFHHFVEADTNFTAYGLFKVSLQNKKTIQEITFPLIDQVIVCQEKVQGY